MKMKKYNIHLLFYILIILTSTKVNGESVLNWFWGKTEDSPLVVSNGVPLVNIPYESLTEDEKFLKEAAKFVTDIQISSQWEVCQHKVIMKIKTSCSGMTEEHLAKLSVNLLNCQSETEGRKTYRCTEEMSIKECTTNMDADTWNAYHLMNNRARAVCYAARSHQFRALTELTVNKLMQSAQTQIKTLDSLKESQDRLEEQTYVAHEIVESNIQQLTEEKALIRAGHTQLAAMAEDIKKKLENASRDLLEQSAERSENHQEILEDLMKIQTHAQLLWEKIESSTNRIIEQNHEAAERYEETLKKLEKINETILYVWELTNTMRDEVDKKLGWITEYIGATGENLEKVYRITLHVMYLFAAMIIAAFLQAPFLTRSAILGVVPINLLSYLKHGLNTCLDFVSLTTLILLITAMHYLINGIHYMLQSKDQNIKENGKNNKNIKFNKNGNVQAYDLTECSEHEQQMQNLSLWSRTLYKISRSWNYFNHQVRQSFGNLLSIYPTIKSWIWRKFITTEELSCSYVPRKYYEHITNKEYASISEDSSDYAETSDHKQFTHENYSVTGAVLRHNAEKTVSPLTAFFKGTNKPKIRETFRIPRSREISPASVTPITTKIACAAKTRSGNPCRLTAPKGQNYCHKHISGSSIMGDY